MRQIALAMAITPVATTAVRTYYGKKTQNRAEAVSMLAVLRLSGSHWVTTGLAIDYSR